MVFNVILACDSNNGIGCNNELPWNFKEDLQFFKKKTTSNNYDDNLNVVVMGRKTWESIPNNFLENRINIVITSNKEKYSKDNPNVIFIDSFESSIKYIEDNLKYNKVYVIGGSEIYNLAFSSHKINKVYITRINGNFNCDCYINLPKLKILKEFNKSFLNRKDKQMYPVTYQVAQVIPNVEVQYLKMLKSIMLNGEKRMTRNGYTYSEFGKEFIINLEDGFPLLTTKRMFWKGIVEELLFFIRGDTDSKKLEDKGIRIWKGNTSKEFLNSVNLDYNEGEMGPMYGYQWRYFNKKYKSTNEDQGIDQFKNLIALIKKDPHSRRLLMTDFNPSQVEEGVLYPCHSLILQFYVNDDKLSVKMYQRSADFALGIPFNIASTSLLLTIVAKLCNLKPYQVIITLGDCHIYDSHIQPLNDQFNRLCYPLPKLEIPNFTTLEEVENSTLEDYKITNYKYHPSIKMEMVA